MLLDNSTFPPPGPLPGTFNKNNFNALVAACAGQGLNFIPSYVHRTGVLTSFFAGQFRSWPGLIFRYRRRSFSDGTGWTAWTGWTPADMGDHAGWITQQVTGRDHAPPFPGVSKQEIEYHWLHPATRTKVFRVEWNELTVLQSKRPNTAAVVIDECVRGLDITFEFQASGRKLSWTHETPADVTVSDFARVSVTATPLVIIGVRVESSGASYSQASPPSVVFTPHPAGGSGAAAVCRVGADGRITSVELTNAGSGYLGIPAVATSTLPLQSIIRASVAGGVISSLALLANLGTVPEGHIRRFGFLPNSFYPLASGGKGRQMVRFVPVAADLHADVLRTYSWAGIAPAGYDLHKPQTWPVSPTYTMTGVVIPHQLINNFFVEFPTRSFISLPRTFMQPA